MADLTIQTLETELKDARNTIAPKIGAGDLKSGFAKSMRFYHNSKTRHHALVFKLENGETVFKELRDNALEVVKTFSDAKKIALWYDADKVVHQFVLNYEF